MDDRRRRELAAPAQVNRIPGPPMEESKKLCPSAEAPATPRPAPQGPVSRCTAKLCPGCCSGAPLERARERPFQEEPQSPDPFREQPLDSPHPHYSFLPHHHAPIAALIPRRDLTIDPCRTPSSFSPDTLTSFSRLRMRFGVSDPRFRVGRRQTGSLKAMKA